jgi:hypothetical protein
MRAGSGLRLRPRTSKRLRRRPCACMRQAHHASCRMIDRLVLSSGFRIRPSVSFALRAALASAAVEAPEPERKYAVLDCLNLPGGTPFRVGRAKARNLPFGRCRVMTVRIIAVRWFGRFDYRWRVTASGLARPSAMCDDYATWFRNNATSARSNPIKVRISATHVAIIPSGSTCLHNRHPTSLRGGEKGSKQVVRSIQETDTGCNRL